MRNKERDQDYFNTLSQKHFPEYLGVEILSVGQEILTGQMKIEKHLFAPNGFLHAGSIVSFADTLAGYATLAHLSDNEKSFTTLELKSNFISSAKKGFIIGQASAIHIGKSTHVWKVDVKRKADKRLIASFSCTQLILKISP